MKLYSEKTVDKIIEIIAEECDDETQDRIRDRLEKMDEAGGRDMTGPRRAWVEQVHT